MLRSLVIDVPSDLLNISYAAHILLYTILFVTCTGYRLPQCVCFVIFTQHYYGGLPTKYGGIHILGKGVSSNSVDYPDAGASMLTVRDSITGVGTAYYSIYFSEFRRSSITCSALIIDQLFPISTPPKMSTPIYLMRFLVLVTFSLFQGLTGILS